MTEQQIWTPLELEAELAGGAEELIDRLTALGDELDDLLVQEKALVLRGFGVTPDDLDGVLELLLPGWNPRVYGTTGHPDSDVCTACACPPRLTVHPHGELTHSHAWPSRLAFYCETEPVSGGATAVVDTELWLNSLDVEIREAFTGGLRYVRTLHDGRRTIGEGWQDTFRTSRREDVEALLDGAGAGWRWLADGGIRIEVARPATVRHPVTGVEVWFNDAARWHPEDAHGGASARASHAGDARARNVTFADGGPVPPEYIRQVRDRGLDHTVDVEWHAGDLLVLDNVLVAHGRRPYTGDRRVLVAMSK